MTQYIYYEGIRSLELTTTAVSIQTSNPALHSTLTHDHTVCRDSDSCSTEGDH